jgi:hypothetical protein
LFTRRSSTTSWRKTKFGCDSTIRFISCWYAFLSAWARRSTQRVDFADDLPFGHAADGRVAAHLRDGIAVGREQRRAGPHPRCRQGRFAAGMAGADHQHIEIIKGSGHGKGKWGMWNGGWGIKKLNFECQLCDSLCEMGHDFLVSRENFDAG